MAAEPLDGPDIAARQVQRLSYCCVAQPMGPGLRPPLRRGLDGMGGHLKETADRETAIQDELSAEAVAYLKSKPRIGLAKTAWLWAISSDETDARRFFREKFVEGVNGGGMMGFLALLKKHGGESEFAFVNENLGRLGRFRQGVSILAGLYAKELAEARRYDVHATPRRGLARSVGGMGALVARCGAGGNGTEIALITKGAATDPRRVRDVPRQ